MKNYTIAIIVSNLSGVLTRVTSMFTRRGYNIDTLTVGETEDPEFSRITVTVYTEESGCNQIVSQLKKMHDVKNVAVLNNSECVTRELVLIKVKNSPENRQDILSAVDVFRSKIIDYSTTSVCIEITGEPTKINAFIELVRPYGIMEICRTGIVSLSRGESCLLK
ncbi:MAG: acetolactate synthase small subunit [Oscillospiraceae bacterium]|nr:acetolactate synthase small subunit [Oscillospiraceae bacterium]MDD6084777.1 acetolactate synthase small subunit [Oscillospiraceae bacterium]MDY3256919.1 acetolactate synthase small subunit [Ruminococcus callidus]